MNAGSSSSPYFTLTLPNESLTYNVRVAAVNTQGRAQSNVLAVCPGMNRMRGIKILCVLLALNDCKHVKAMPPFTGPEPPTDVPVVVTTMNSVVVSWDAQQSSMCNAVIGNYSVRYQLRGCACSNATVYTSSTSVTLQDLVPNAEYSVSVAAIYSNGGMSVYSAAAQFTVTPVAPPSETYVMIM